MSTESPPTSLVANKYQVVRMIGRGGMGAVWEGRHTSLGTRVAIKFIDSEFADRPEVQKRFETEAKSAATIQSKHAIQIFDHGIGDDGRPYIVMEFLEGEPLDARLSKAGKMPLPAIAHILQQIGRALTRAHEQGIVHRDLKPENVFLVRTADDDDEVAKVLDFGIAKIVGTEANSLTSATKTGAILGTPFYMAPEQARGLKEVDARADQWSLAVIAYRAVTASLPFDGQSVGDLLVNICTQDPLPPSQIEPSLSPAFDAWMQRSLSRDVSLRFASVKEQMDALTLAAGLSLRTVPSSQIPSAPHQTLAMSGTPMPRLASAPISAGTPVPAGTLGGGITSSGSATLGGASSRGRWTVVGIGVGLLLVGGFAVLLMVLSQRAGDTPSAGASEQPPQVAPEALPSAAPSAIDGALAAASAPTRAQDPAPAKQQPAATNQLTAGQTTAEKPAAGKTTTAKPATSKASPDKPATGKAKVPVASPDKAEKKPTPAPAPSPKKDPSNPDFGF